MVAKHMDTLCTLAYGILIKTGGVRHREAREFAQGHTALQGHHPFSLTLETPHLRGTVRKGPGR